MFDYGPKGKNTRLYYCRLLCNHQFIISFILLLIIINAVWFVVYSLVANTLNYCRKQTTVRRRGKGRFLLVDMICSCFRDSHEKLNYSLRNGVLYIALHLTLCSSKLRVISRVECLNEKQPPKKN